LVAIAAIVGSIRYLESGGGLPLLGQNDAHPGDGSPGVDFYSLEAQGIKLGAAGGPAPKEGEPAPDFILLDVNGNVVRLSDFKGKAVVLNFWATWCVPCRQEFPELINAYDRNKDKGLVIIGVNVRENASSVRKFADDFGARYPILVDTDGSVSSQYRIQGLPVTWFIDRDGVARAQIIGLLTKNLLRINLNDLGFSAEAP
jgi:peroxiredoxin